MSNVIDFSSYMNSDSNLSLEELVKKFNHKKKLSLPKFSFPINSKLKSLYTVYNNIKTIYENVEDQFKHYSGLENKLFSQYLNYGKELKTIESSLQEYEKNKISLDGSFDNEDIFSDDSIKVQTKIRNLENQIRLGKIAYQTQMKKVKNYETLFNLTKKYSNLYSSIYATTNHLMEGLDSIIKYVEYNKDMLRPGDKLMKNLSQGLVYGVDAIEKSNLILKDTLSGISDLNNIGQGFILSDNGLEKANSMLSDFENKFVESTNEFEEELNKQLEEIGIKF